MKKATQVNIMLEGAAAQNVTEYCRVHGITPEELFLAGAQRLIDEDILERNADLMTIRALREMNKGLSEPIDDLLEMLEEDEKAGEEMIAGKGPVVRKTA